MLTPATVAASLATPWTPAGPATRQVTSPPSLEAAVTACRVTWAQHILFLIIIIISVVILTGDSLELSCSARTRVEAWRWVARRADCRSTALDLELSIVTG